ncbi:MAG: HisA/HisF-related TIM barrel protein [Oleispira sp.]
MLRKRIIPIVLLDGFSVLKTINFSRRRNLGSPITVMRTYNTRNVDELILLDIDASNSGRSIDKFTLLDITKECFMPLSVGGGISTIKDIEDLLSVGADKVVLNTAALKDPQFINSAANRFGSQCIIISIDVIKTNDKYLVYNKNCEDLELELTDWLLQVERQGAGEILINSVDLDGSLSGGDSALAELAASVVNIPVIYCGGISTPKNAADIAALSVSAVAAASIFHFTEHTPEECRQALSIEGVPVR